MNQRPVQSIVKQSETGHATNIIGGLGSLKGTVAAAILIGISDGIISVFFSPNLAKILATLLVVVVLLIRPNGLFGTIRQ